MKVATPLGLFISFAALAIAVQLEGGELSGFLNLPAALVVFGGTLGAVLAGFPAHTVLQLPRYIGRALVDKAPAVLLMARTLVRLAERARREGLLALEEELGSIDNLLLRRGVMLVIDGTDADLVRSVLQSDLAIRQREQENESGLLEAMGGYAPTMGIIGTVMGLVHVLSQLDEPSELGGAIAVAFVATLYGVASANMLWLPLASKLKKRAEAEQLLDEMILEGIASIQSGENPRVLEERLAPYLPKREQGQSLREQETDAVPGRIQEDFQPGRA